MTQEDKDFIRWIYNRLVYVHDESPSFDYMKRLKTMFLDKDIDKEIAENLKACKMSLARIEAVNDAQKN